MSSALDFKLKQDWLMDYKQLFHVDLWKSLGAVFWADEWQMTGRAGVETEFHIYWSYENYGYVAYDWGRLYRVAVIEWVAKIVTCYKHGVRLYLEKLRRRIFWATNVMWLIALETEQFDMLLKNMFV